MEKKPLKVKCDKCRKETELQRLEDLFDIPNCCGEQMRIAS